MKIKNAKKNPPTPPPPALTVKNNDITRALFGALFFFQFYTDCSHFLEMYS